MDNAIPVSFFAESAVATFIITPEHRVIFWNKACEKLTGMRASQVLNNKSHWQAFYPEERSCLVDIVIDGKYDDLPHLYEKFGKSKLSPEGIRAEGWYENLGGLRRYIIFDASPIFNSSGELIAAIETLQDITEIKNGDLGKEKIVSDLESILSEGPILKGFLVICSACQDVRNTQGAWIDVASYFTQKNGLLFSHGICPKCTQKLYPEYYDKVLK